MFTSRSVLRIRCPLALLATGGRLISLKAAGSRLWEPRIDGNNLGEKTVVEKAGVEKN